MAAREQKPVLSQPSDIIRELITLRKRISEITLRVRRDVDLLTDAYQEVNPRNVATSATPSFARPMRPLT
jgi:hypothetical protein